MPNSFQKDLIDQLAEISLSLSDNLERIDNSGLDETIDTIAKNSFAGQISVTRQNNENVLATRDLPSVPNKLRGTLEQSISEKLLSLHADLQFK